MKICPTCGAANRNGRERCENCHASLQPKTVQANITWILIAVLSFAFGVFGISGYAVHEQHKVEAEKNEAQARVDAELARQMAMKKQELEQASHLDNMSEEEQQYIDGGAKPPAKKEEEDAATFTELSPSVKDSLEDLVRVTGAMSIDTGTEFPAYETENGAISMAYVQGGYELTISAPCQFSIFDVYLGMNKAKATKKMMAQGLTASDSDEDELNYAIDGTRNLYMTCSENKVSALRLSVRIATEDDWGD